MRIGMLGPFEVRTDAGDSVDVPGARLRGLLAALALEPGQVVPKGTLVDWIWGEQPPADAANALQRLVSRLRKVFPDGVVEGHPTGYRLRVDPDDVDAVRFERLVGRARGEARLLREALGLWRGAAMQDVDLPDSGALAAAVTRLDGLRLSATEDRFDAELELGDGAALVAELTDLVAAHPMRERLVAALMRALVASGRDSEALLVYQRTKDALADALGVDPSPDLSALHVALLRGELTRPAEHRRTNLRAELTSYVGKDADVAAVRALVIEHRLTTLIGPGGSGKTRLATETARTLLTDLPDGAWLVELAAVGNVGADSDVAAATLAGFDLRDTLLGDTSNAEPTERLVAALRDRELLLVLDNCEHVIDAAAALAHRLLGECRRLRILATSREPLNITGETLWPVAPLEPESAVRLLTDRASAVRQDLAADPHTMLRICRALDGMPLAIELAAARLRTMSIDQLATRLDDRFRLLTGGSRTALPRHRTLRAMVDWSWELLSDDERRVLRRLSVFSGGAGLDAAERVCGGADVLELLTALTEKSLLVAAGGATPRYRMLGTIKEYATQRLAEADETDLARRAHLAYFTELTETADPHLRRAEQTEWLATLAADHDNLVSATRGALAAGEAQAAMRIVAGAGWYWWLGGHKAEGIELVLAANATPGDVDDATRVVVYGYVVGFASSGRGADQYDAAEWIHRVHEIDQRVRSRHPAVELVLPLEQLLRRPDDPLSAWEPMLDNEDPWVRAMGRLHIGRSRIALGHPGRDVDAGLSQALDEFRALGERWGMSFALTELADRVAVRGEFARACAYLEEATVVVTEVGATEDVIRIRSRQAEIYWLLGDDAAAASALAEAERAAGQVTWPEALVELAMAKAGLASWRGDAAEARHHLGRATTLLGDKAAHANIRAGTHTLLGHLADDVPSARHHHTEACRAAAETGHRATLAQTIVGVADLALRLDRPAQAARLLGASTAVRGLADHSNPAADRIEHSARNRLGDTEFAEAVRDGTEADWTTLVEITLAS